MNELLAKIFAVMSHRLIAAWSTIPDTKVWLQSAGLLLLLTLISLPIGFRSGFFRASLLQASWVTIVGIAMTAFLMPAIAEELFFRVLLLPHPTENPTSETQWVWGCVSLILFLVYHPLNGLSFFPTGLKTFREPIFLLLAALLGVVCAIAYLQSGSLWPPVVIHWLVVVVWLLLLGGYKQLYP
jgi:predicted Abi (CAAX) family protease